MSFSDLLRRLQAAPDYRGQIAHVERIPRRSAVFQDPRQPVHPVLAARLAEQGIHRLYTHQAQALEAARAGRNAVIVTGTASGKTLCYNLPVVENILDDHRARALYVFPTKALAQDQLGKLNDLGVFPQVTFATYDGDTPQDERRFIKRGAHIVLTNPDMLHVGILPYHTQWTRFLANLRWVVLDEVHSCRGVFGAHVAQVIRRLRRLCAQYGARPVFLCCSATIANPAEHARRLTGLDFQVISEDGSPQGMRTFVFWNPPLLGHAGGRRSAHVESASLFARLVAEGVRNITFARARKSAELILKYAREAFSKEAPELASRVMSYRAGYTPEDRRRIERGLLEGDLIGVTATNALELGVDVGGLDATILTGYPGTIASAWQQAGRAGRTGTESLSILVALDNPLDQYLMRHPDYFFGQVHEQAVVDPENPRILSAHLECAAYELPVGGPDLDLYGPPGETALAALEEEGRLVRRANRWYYRGSRYPAGDISIRSASLARFEIRDASQGGRLLGEVEEARAFSTVHPGAVYLHQGDAYVVEHLDLTGRVATVRPVDAAYYTEPREVTLISVVEERKSRPLGPARACFGQVVVSSQVLGYRVKQLYSEAVLQVVDLDLPEQVFETEGLWFTVPPALVAALAGQGLDLAGAIHAAEHAAIGMMPLIVTCDRWDVGGVSTPHHPDTGLPTVFIYDGYPGGVGITEAAHTRLEELLGATLDAVAACPCADGCPSCVQSPKCGNNNEPLDKAGAAVILRGLLAEAAPAAKGESCSGDAAA